MDKTKTYYCPKCGHKKLVSDHAYSGNGYYRIWVCLHNVPPERRRYSSKPRKELGPPCGLKIKAEGRDANIDDYDDLLGKLATIGVPEVQQWMLQHKRSIHKKGLEVLYQGPLVDLVRCNDGDGVGVGLWWRGATWDTGAGLINPTEGSNNALRSEAAQYVMFRGFSCSTLFARNGADIWKPGDDTAAVFKGKSLGKKLKERLVRFAIALEQELPELIKLCKSERQRWVNEQARYEEALSLYGRYGGVTLSHYCGERKTGRINVRQVRPAEAKAMEELLGFEIKLDALSVHPSQVSPDQAIEIERIVGADLSFNVSRYFGRSFVSDRPERRFTQAEAVALTTLLETTCKA